MQATETEGLEGKLDDENSGTADLSGVERESRLPLYEKLVPPAKWISSGLARQSGAIRNMGSGEPR